MIRAVVAWLAFVVGCGFCVVDVVRVQVTGLMVLGVVLLVAWLWLIGGFTRSFWVENDPDPVPSVLDERDGRRL